MNLLNLDLGNRKCPSPADSYNKHGRDAQDKKRRIWTMVFRAVVLVLIIMLLRGEL
jgi:hypothetical protein